MIKLRSVTYGVSASEREPDAPSTVPRLVRAPGRHRVHLELEIDGDDVAAFKRVSSAALAGEPIHVTTDGEELETARDAMACAYSVLINLYGLLAIRAAIGPVVPPRAPLPSKELLDSERESLGTARQVLSKMHADGYARDGLPSPEDLERRIAHHYGIAIVAVDKSNTH